MNSFRTALVVFLLLIVLQVQGENSVTLDGRIDTNESQSQVAWIGVFELPIRRGAEATSWTLVKSREFTFDVPDVDAVQLVVLSQDSLPLVQRIQPRARDSKVVFKFGQGIKLDGTILSTEGMPVADARLTIERKDLPPIQVPDHVEFRWTSDADGRISIGGLEPNNEYKINVDLQYVPTESFEVRLSGKANYQRDFRLSNAYFVMGRVLDVDRARVEEAVVSFDLDVDSWTEGPTTTSDSEGEFLIGPFGQNKEMWLQARHLDKGSSKRLRALSGDHHLELVLEGMVQVFGMVIDSSTGDPINDFTLVAIRADGSREYPHTEAKGEISIYVDPRTIGLIVDSEHHVVQLIEDLALEAAGEYDLGVIELEGVRQVVVQVEDASTGDPIAGAIVTPVFRDRDETVSGIWQGFISSYMREAVRSTTDSDGKFVLKRLPEDLVQTNVSARGYQSQEVEISAIASSVEVRLSKDLKERTRIQGIVETAEGKPIGGRVVVQAENGSRMRTTTYRDGRFDVGVEEGIFELLAVTDQGRSDKVRVTVAEGEIREIRLVIDSRGRLTGAIEGLWDDEKVSLELRSVSEGVTVRHLWAVENGHFVIEGVGLGKFNITAESNRNREQVKSFEIGVESGEAHVELSFAGNSRVYGSLRFSNGAVPQGEVSLHPKQDGKTSSSSQIDGEGTFSVSGLDDGEYTLLIFETQQVVFKNDERGFGAGRSTLIHEREVQVSGDVELDILLSESANTD